MPPSRRSGAYVSRFQRLAAKVGIQTQALAPARAACLCLVPALQLSPARLPPRAQASDLVVQPLRRAHWRRERVQTLGAIGIRLQTEIRVVHHGARVARQEWATAIARKRSTAG